MKRRDLTDLLLLSALWGASFLLMRVAVPEFGPLAMIFFRTLIAAAFLLTLLQWHGELAGLRQKPLTLLALGALNSALPFALLAMASLHLTAGFAALLNATTPLWAAVIAALWLRQPIRPMQVAGMVLATAGVAELLWGRVDFAEGGSGWAIVAGLAAPLSYGLAANFSRRYLTGVPSRVQATGSQVSATLLLVPTIAWSWPALPPSPLAWGCVVVLGVACTGLAYVLYFRLIANVGAVRASSVTFLVPVFAASWGLLLLHEPITVNMLVGGAIVLVGCALALGLWPTQRPTPTKALDAVP